MNDGHEAGGKTVHKGEKIVKMGWEGGVGGGRRFQIRRFEYEVRSSKKKCTHLCV